MIGDETQSQSLSVLLGLLDSLPKGAPRLATTANVGSTLAQLTTLGPAELNNLRIITVAWRRLPAHPAIVEETLDQLAEAAQALWPKWYLTESCGEDGKGTFELLWERVRKAGLERSVVPHWLQLADNACQAQKRPRWTNDFTAAVEARQLALALGERSCRLVLAAQDEAQDAASLLGMARGSEWLARETNLPLLLLAPTSLASDPELDSVNFLRVELPFEATRETETLSLLSLSSAGGTSCSPDTPITRKSRLLVHPLIGRPHPDSRGEQMLWARLQSDVELAERFLSNQWAATVCETTYLVDFVWPGGKVIVEVDGYYWHSQPFQFANDRNRDYELQLSGYVVLRLPHDAVVADVGGAVEKIRRLVHLQQRRCDRGDFN